MILATLALAACSWRSVTEDPVPTLKVPAREPAAGVLVAVLPGFIYDEEDLYEFGVAEVIQRGWPGADVVLVGATMPYYQSGLLAQRVHEGVIAPARAQGYKEIWLIGGSLGGMGVLLYEWAHPGELTGLVLLSPFVGSDDLLDEIRKAGLADWQPGSPSPEMTGSNYQERIWAMFKGWRAHPELARRVWLACGTDDPLYPDAQLLAKELPPGQVLFRPGGHDWAFWNPATEEIFGRIAAGRGSPRGNTARRSGAAGRAEADLSPNAP